MDSSWMSNLREIPIKVIVTQNMNLQYIYINIHVGILVWLKFEYRRICPNWTGILSSNKMKIDEIQFLISTRLNWNDFLNE